ncbi:MAG: S-4TM family putative pore-forming effector [Lachnospiraceae bacterium]|nr:S-4TM family putative pore-forming effector [Lachnospiraceae bacterium]
MNIILINTHKKDNINLLKARDFYFNKAKKLNKLNKVFLFLPALVLALSYLVYIPDLYCDFVDSNRDIITGFLTILCAGVNYVLSKSINSYTYKSNVLREEYDNNVFELARNEFVYNYSICEKDAKSKEYSYYKDALKQSNFNKYEVWYEEIFCDKMANNIMCCQMDNIIYTYHVYVEHKKMEKVNLTILGLIDVILFSIIFFCFHMVTPIVLIILAQFSILQNIFERLQIAEDLINEIRHFKEKIMEEGFIDRVNTSNESLNYCLRTMQDCLISYRNNSLFINKKLREKYLNPGNPYYKDLDDIKNKFLKIHDVTMPDSASEIEILSIKDQNKSYKLCEVQDRLKEMMCDVLHVLEDAKITYTLDGGTLIGSIREEKFVFWDDDVDIAIPIEQLEVAKQIIKDKLKDYVIQDYYNDIFYSPRLSNMRIRERKSIIEEKDSELYEEYENRGLFIDVYSYTPILINRFIDNIYRRLFIYTINKKIKKTEHRYIYTRKNEKVKNRFIKQKQCYLSRVEFYLKYARNKKYYAYVPTYIDNLKKSGPYIKKEYLYNEKDSRHKFENMECLVPYNSDEVLKCYYGENWRESPFKSLDKLKNYSEKKFCVTSLKHIKYIDLY